MGGQVSRDINEATGELFGRSLSVQAGHGGSNIAPELIPEASGADLFHAGLADAFLLGASGAVGWRKLLLGTLVSGVALWAAGTNPPAEFFERDHSSDVR